MLDKNTNKKPRIVFEQYVLAHYHVPFLIELSKLTDLTVVLSENREVDGLNDIKEELPFKTVRLREGTKNELFHPEIFRVLDEQKAEVLISISSIYNKLLSSHDGFGKIKTRGIKTLWVGCDGYMIRHFIFNLIYRLIYFRLTIPTIKEILSKSRIDHFLPYSSQTVNFLHLSRLVPKNKMQIVCNAIDTSEINNFYQNFKQTGHKNPGKIIFTGRLTKSKSVDVLIRAFATISTEITELTLDIVGEGSELENLKNLAGQLEVTDKINFVGALYEDRELAPYLCQASLFIMPGLGGLGFNTAMAAGLPIIHTHADGTEKELIINNFNGWFFDGSEPDLVKKIKLAFSDRTKLEKMGKESERILSEKCTIKKMVDGYMEAINKVLYEKEN
jgi:glycosyltransferase involved in cell wall biosynthesis